MGWMEELPEDVARERFGTRLAIAALGVVEEKEKIRVVHDASHTVHVNHKIKVRDQIRCPGAGANWRRARSGSTQSAPTA